jgi:hypothetical protein
VRAIGRANRASGSGGRADRRETWREIAVAARGLNVLIAVVNKLA